MTEGVGPTIRRRQLGMEMRRLREAARVSREQAAEHLGIQPPALSKIETGKQRLNLAYLKLLLQLYEVGSPHADALEQLLQSANQRGWWAAYGDTVPEWFQQYVGMESAAEEIWSYESELVPGLLQTPGYVRAVARVVRPHSTDAELDQSVRFRTARQDRLDGDRPTRLHAVLNEAVLMRLVGGRDVMREQLQHLVATARQPNVTVRVIPFSAGAHPAMKGPFTMLRFDEELKMNTVYVELEGAAVYREKPREIDRYTVVFSQLTDLALGADESIELIGERANEL